MTENIQSKKGLSIGEGCRTFAVMFALLVVPVWIYSSRAIETKFIAYPFYMALPFVLGGWLCSIILSLLAAAVYTVGQVYGWFKTRRSKALSVAILVLSAIFIARFAPVPPTAEQVYFSQYRDEFKQQVVRIKQGQTVAQPDNFGPYSRYITISSLTDAVAFDYAAENFKSEYAFVYAENYSDMGEFLVCSADTSGSGGQGRIYTLLDTNWYLCYRAGD